MAKFNPCVDYCYIKHNKQYSEDCNDKCDYAQAVLDVKKYKAKYEKCKAKYNELRKLTEDDGK